ncbi:hypothetical protein JRI60_40170 [Archangium violaceum]|uniref:hypothetical protein n=1 Tax=Archangium violaceum TaxID=83451 RepID=UPI00195248E6|nr:hypothetical protein [Archangium violaceum]QRN95238.1 hypothetical protein JRI60_40170 [Archangium violaceum]
MTHPQTHVSRLTSWLTTLAVGVAGCGEYGLADETYPVEPVAILEGELRAKVGSGQGPTAMTLAWAPELAATERLASLLLAEGSSCGTEREALLQPTSFQPHFPSSFVLPLSTTPVPAAQLALEPSGGRGRLALGWIVFFQDDNGNGSLDLGSEGAGGERVVATSLDSGLAVLFLDGTLPSERSGAWERWPREVPRGFSLLGVQRPEGGPASFVSLPASTSLALEGSRHACP